MKKALQTIALLLALTLPGVVSAQLFEGFETCTGNGIPAGWTQNSDNTTLAAWESHGSADLSMYADYFGTTIRAPHTGSLCGMVFGQQGSGTALISPAIDLSGMSNPVITFWYANNAIMGMYGSMVVKYSADGGTTWTTAATYNTQVDNWTEVTLAIPASALSANFKMRFDFSAAIYGLAVLDDIAVGEGASCADPTHLAFSAIHSTNASLHWTGDANAQGYNVAVGAPGFDPDTVASNFTYDTAFTLTSLGAGESYEVAVQSDCGGSLSDWARLAFSTPMCDEGGCNLYISFSQTAGSQYDLVIGYQHIRALQSNAELGVYNALDSNVVNVCPDYPVHFIWGNSYPYYASFVNFTITDAWGNDLYSGSGADHSTGDTLFTFTPTCTEPLCLRPVNPVIDSVEATTARATWSDGDQENPAGIYRVLWGTQNDPSQATDSILVGDTTCLLTGLSPQTTYYAWVRAICGGDPSLERAFPGFTTGCAPIAPSDLPYQMDFDALPGSGNLAQAPCWSLIQGQGGNPCPYHASNQAYSHSGVTSLSFYATGGNPNLIALPPFENLSALTLTFWAYQWTATSYDLFVVGVMEGDNFVGIDTIPSLGVGVANYAAYTVSFGSYQGTGNRPAFYAKRNSGELRINIDDITVDLTPDCLNPSNVHATSATTDGISLTWNGNESLTYEVGYDTVPLTNDLIYSQTTTTGTSITLTGLEQNQLYHIYVRSICPGGYGNWIHTTARTERCEETCPLTVATSDDYATAWTYNHYTFLQEGVEIADIHSNLTTQVQVCPNDTVTLRWTSTTTSTYYSTHTGITVSDAWGNELFSQPIGQSCPNGELGFIATSCEQPECVRPTGLYVDQVDSVSAMVHWVDSVSHGIGTWAVEYGPQGFFTPGHGTWVEQVQDSALLTSLLPNTVYEVYVHTICLADTLTSNPIAFRTDCGTIGMLPWSDDFDSTPDEAVPFCWMQHTSPNGVNPCVNRLNGTYAHSGNGFISMWTGTGSGPENVIALPRFAQSINTLQITFWAKHSGNAPSVFSLGYIDDSGAYVGMDTITSLTTTHQAYTFYCSGYPADGRRLAFYNRYGIVYVDDVAIDLIPDCLPVSDLAVDSATTTSLTIAWNDAHSTTWEYIFDSLPIGNDALYTPVTVSAPTATLTGLTTGTTYYIYVRPVCTGASTWSPLVATTPLCDNGCELTVVMHDSYGDGWNGASITVTQNGRQLDQLTLTSGQSNATATLAICPGSPLSFVWTPGSYPGECSFQIYDSWGTMIHTTVGAGSLPAGEFLSYTTDCQTSSCPAPRNLQATNVSDTSATITWIDSASGWTLLYDANPFSPTAPNATTLSLTVATASAGLTGLQPSTTYYVSVQAQCTGTAVWSDPLSFTTLAFDSLSSCLPATDIVLVDTTTTSVTLDWTDLSEGAAYYEIEYGPAGFTPGQGTLVTTSSRPYFLNGLNSSTTYQVRIRVHCGSDQSAQWSGLYSFSTLCDVFQLTSASPLFESFESEEAPAGCWTIVSDHHNNLGSVVNTPIHSTDRALHGSRSFRFSSYSQSSDGFDQYLVSPQIDGAGDMTLRFSYMAASQYSTGEHFRVGYSATSADPTDSAAWTWGPETIAGNVNSWERHLDSMPASTQYVAIHYWAQYQYYLYIDSLLLTTPAAGCLRPANVTASQVDYQGATIAWNGTGSSYELACKAVGDAAYGPAITLSGNTHQLSGLLPATSYVVRVRQLCGEDAVSQWAEGSFTTDSLPCFAPEQLHTTQVTGTTATLAWTPTSFETEWELQLAAQGDTSITHCLSSTALLTELLTNVTYTAQVRPLCGIDRMEGPWSNPVEFTTLECPMPSGLAATNVAATAATLTWTAPEGHSEFELLYGTEEDANSMTTVQVSGTSHTLTGLQADVRYYVTLRTKCAEGWVSDLTPFINFRTVGIDAADASAISLFPNPASGQATIQGYEGEVLVVDLTGRTKFVCQISQSANTLDLSSLAAGTYFVRMGSIVKKLIVK